MSQRLLPLLCLCACLTVAAPLLRAADAPASAAPAPAPAATPVDAKAAVGSPQAQPAVNTSFLEKCSSAADVLVGACKTSGAASALGGMFSSGSSKDDANKNAARLTLAQGFKSDIVSLYQNKKIAPDGAFATLVVNAKDGISSKFKGIPVAGKLQSVFADGGMGKSLMNALPVDKVPGYQKAIDQLKSITH